MKRLLLIGGGHSHVEVLRRFAVKRDSTTQITLISPMAHTPYSGMLPGLIAGHYDFRQCHIDLPQLANHAQCRFVESEVIAIDTDAKAVSIATGAHYGFDVASIDIGSTPVVAGVVGVHEHAIPVKPTHYFLKRWEQLLQRAGRNGLAAGFRVAVVGGGAAGIEVLLAMQYRLDNAGCKGLSYSVLSDSENILPSHRPVVRKAFEKILQQRGVSVHCHQRIVKVGSNSFLTESGASFPADFVIWATGASAADWPAASELAVTAQGFIRVADTLQSISHPHIFAAGDIASMEHAPRPKSGVYAVRQGPPLAENLRRALNDEGPLPYHPQQQALALISAGGRYAVASRGWFFSQGRWVWRWKDYIDRSFMRRYDLKT